MASNLYDEIDGDTIAAEVVLLRAASTKSVMLVEGANDEKIFIHFVDEDKCEIVICHGHENAVDALRKLEGRSISGILCVVDADFSAFVGPHVGCLSLFSTDDHDMEVTLFKSRAFDRVLAELGSNEKIRKLKEKGLQPREPIWRAAHRLGIFRLYSSLHGLNLKFKEISFKFVDRRSLSVDIDLMIKTVFDNSRKPVAGIQDIRQFISKWTAESHDHWQMCSGHDLAAIFGRALQSLLGTQPSATMDGPIIERQLRLAYSMDQFKETTLYKGIRDWEQKYAPFTCLQEF